MRAHPWVSFGKGLGEMKTILTALVGLGVGLGPVQAEPQTACECDAMVVFDGPGSMVEMGFNLMDEPRILDTRRAMCTDRPQVAPLRRTG